MEQTTTQSGKSPLFIPAGCGLPSCWACFDWDWGVTLPHISFSSLRGINHPVKARQFYSVVCESAYNPHNSTAHLRPMYPNVQLNKPKSLQLGILSQFQWPKRSFTKPVAKSFWLINSFQVIFFPLLTLFCCPQIKKIRKQWKEQNKDLRLLMLATDSHHLLTGEQ